MKYRLFILPEKRFEPLKYIEMNEQGEISKAYKYLRELYASRIYDLFLLIDRIIKDRFYNTLEWERSKEIIQDALVEQLISAVRRKISEIKEMKSDIRCWSEIKNGKVDHFYYDGKTKAYLSRHETYITDDIFVCYKKILEDYEDFVGKQEVLEIIHDEYLRELSHEACLESIECRGNMDDLLDLYNNPRYKEVREVSIAPAISDKMAEELSLDDVLFKDIEEAKKAYEEDGTRENLAQLKKLYMIKAEEETVRCHDYDKLAKMLEEAKFECVRRIIIRRMAYLDIKNS